VVPVTSPFPLPLSSGFSPWVVLNKDQVRMPDSKKNGPSHLAVLFLSFLFPSPSFFFRFSVSF